MADPQDYDFSKFCATEGTVVPGEGIRILPLVLTDMKLRAEQGYDKYGKDYCVNTRPDPLREAYEEVLDAAIYLRAAIERGENDNGM